MTSLVDGFGRLHRYLRISVTDRCNLRCLYCMPPGKQPTVEHCEEGGAVNGVPDRLQELGVAGGASRLLRFEEIVACARVFADLGVTKIRLTGGEPLVRSGVVTLVRDLAELHGIQQLGMTTNGVLLSRYASELREAGLTHLNVSLDTLRPDRFARIAMQPAFNAVLTGIDAAFEAGFPSIKLNVVVMGGINDDELPSFAELARTRPIHVRFIEYMPFRFNGWNTASFVSWRDMQRRIDVVPDWNIARRNPGESGVAREYLIEGWKGSIGFITSMSDHFCGDCNRLRLTADGSVKSCLFHPAEVNLRHALRSGFADAEIATMIRSAVALKPEAHAPVEQLVAIENRSMIEIGG